MKFEGLYEKFVFPLLFSTELLPALYLVGLHCTVVP